MKPYITISEEVRSALEQKLPVVALETTIISFGFPYPYNIQMALEMEEIIRRHGAVPATIGLKEGKIKVGLGKAEIEEFATEGSVLKAGRRDFPYVLAQKKLGATTISGTMIAAGLAGIHVFATGGLGGVHRHGEVTWDVSVDLTEMSLTNVAVVSSGAKAILDLGRTLEVLETLGVPVVGYQSDYFASFYSRQSGLKANFRLDTPEEVATMMDAKWSIGLNGGILVANPVPEQDEIPFAEIDEIIKQAVEEANAEGIAGKEVTPYLLKRINHHTKGRSLETNISLVRENAKVGAQIAVAYQHLQNSR